MTAVFLYLVGIVFVFLVLHFVRGRQSNLWHRSVPRQSTSQPLAARRNYGETTPGVSVPYEEVKTDERKVVPHC